MGKLHARAEIRLLQLNIKGRCSMSSFTFDVKELDGQQHPTHDQWTNADCCIIIFPPFPSLVVGRLMSSFSINVRFRSTSLFLFDVVVRRD